MSREKQIEKITKLLWHFPKVLHLNCYNDCGEAAELLYNEGYRKQSVGEWIDTGDFELDNIYSGWKCSLCGHIFCGNKTNYCSRCGAKMKGGD